MVINKNQSQQISLPITGMTCAACVRNVERALKKADGVTEVNVNLATEQATIRFTPGATDIQHLVDRVSRSGYGVATASVDLPITGMTCAACERNVARALKKPDGVLDVRVNLATDTATVTYLPGTTRRSDFIAAVERAGYGVIDTANLDAPEDAEQAAREAEIQRQRRLVIIGTVFTVPLVILSMTRHFMHSIPGLMEAFPWLMEDYWLFVFGLLATPVYVLLGRQYIIGGYKSLRNGTANMDVLVAMGSSAAYFYGIIVLLGIIFGFSDLVGKDDYFESAAVILTLITLGKLLEARAKGRTSEAIKKLIGLTPKTAHVIQNGAEVVVPIDDLVAGDAIVVRPGERIPTDGIVIEGRSAVDESMLTGESIPVDKSRGSEVIGGTINRQGRLVFEATRVGAETALSQIIRLVQQAQGTKAPIQRIADQVSAVFVPIVIVLAAITLIGWLALGQVAFTEAILNTIAVLVIACPCALGLATPTAIMVGTGRGAEMGILFKNAESLEQAHKLDSILLDKTGTITRGEPIVTDAISLADIDDQTLLTLAGSAESASEHPLAHAVVSYAKQRDVQLISPETFEAETGRGIRATIDGRQVLVGSPRLMRENSIDLTPGDKDITRLQDDARTVIVVAVDGQLAGVIGIADTVKAGTVEAIRGLRAVGLEVAMVTGDNQHTASAIAREVNIDRVLAEVLPADKADVVKAQQSDGRRVAMVGDGINDAPALAQANVGIAIGTGTDIAMESSDITLMQGNLQGVVTAIQLSHATMRTIYQNLFWAFIYNIILIPIAMLGLLIPMFAAAAMAFSSFFVVSNSLKLRRSSLPLAQDDAPDTAESSRTVSSAPAA
ncbi:MAG: heavy metal translocating P-type ATPase [Chloroflexota bacterium]